MHALNGAAKRVILHSNAQRLFKVPELKCLEIYDMLDHGFILSNHEQKNGSRVFSEFFLLPVREQGFDPSGIWIAACSGTVYLP